MRPVVKADSKLAPLATIHTLSDGTEVTLTVEPSARESFEKTPLTGSAWGVAPFLCANNILRSLEDGLSFVEAAGLDVPSRLDVMIASLPGDGSGSRSHTFPKSGKIVFDVSDTIWMGTVVHELVHVATPRLCASASDFLLEGLATYLQEKYQGRDWNYEDASELRQSITGKKFHRSPGRNSRPEENLCYHYGRHVWILLELIYGEDAVMEFVRRIESEENPISVDQAFRDLTGQPQRYWIRGLYDLEDEHAPPLLLRLLQDPDEQTRWKAAQAYAQLMPALPEGECPPELNNVLIAFFGHADPLVAMRSVVTYKEYFGFLNPEERRQGLDAVRALIANKDAGLQYALVRFYVQTVPILSTEEIGREATALRESFRSENAVLRAKALMFYDLLANHFSPEEIRLGLADAESLMEDPESSVSCVAYSTHDRLRRITDAGKKAEVLE